MIDIIRELIFSGTGAGMVILTLARLLPNERLYVVCRSTGRALTGFGRAHMGRVFWEKVEHFVENSVQVCWDGLRDGWNYDD
jgi:hypothetical protein